MQSLFVDAAMSLMKLFDHAATSKDDRHIVISFDSKAELEHFKEWLKEEYKRAGLQAIGLPPDGVDIIYRMLGINFSLQLKDG